MRRPALALLAVLLAGCAYEPEIDRPGGDGKSPPPQATGEAPGSTAPTFSAEGCPVDDSAFCDRAASLANALVLSDADAVFDLSRPVALSCDDLDRDLFPQCDDRDRLKGYVIGTHQGEFFVDSRSDYRDDLAFFVEAVDEEFSDELGGPEMQILGVSTCGPEGPERSYHVLYLVGLGDPDSTLPGARFLGTYEFTQQGGEWAIGTTYVGLYTDWQLVLDDPLTEIACGHIEPWAGVTTAPNPPRSESQPTPASS